MAPQALQSRSFFNNVNLHCRYPWSLTKKISYIRGRKVTPRRYLVVDAGMSTQPEAG
jgi:hypothetical protein